MIEKLNKIIEVAELAKVDAEKLTVKGVKASSTKVRKAMQEVKALAQEIRTDATEVVNKLKEQ